MAVIDSHAARYASLTVHIIVAYYQRCFIRRYSVVATLMLEDTPALFHYAISIIAAKDELMILLRHYMPSPWHMRFAMLRVIITLIVDDIRCQDAAPPLLIRCQMPLRAAISLLDIFSYIAMIRDTAR